MQIRGLRATLGKGGRVQEEVLGSDGYVYHRDGIHGYTGVDM